MKIDVAAYPQLRLLCWSRAPGTMIDGEDTLARYEANWRHVDEAAMTEEERALLDTLIERNGSGVLSVPGGSELVRSLPKNR